MASGGAPGSGGVPGSGGDTTGSGGTTPSGGSTTGGSGVGGAVGTGGRIGGAPGSGGGTPTGGASSGGAGGGLPPCVAAWTGSPSRPQLTDASAACYTSLRYLAQTGTIGALVTDNWNPTAGLPAASSFTPTFTVAADGSGTHTTVQAAVTAAKAAGGTSRAYILVKPGTYRELVCVDGTRPITLYGADADASRVTIAFDNYNGKAVDPTKVNACAVPAAATYGTSGSSTFFVKADGFQAMNLTISNDFAEGALTTAIQAVALTTQSDLLVFQNVSILGNQDTLQVKSPTVALVTRAYFKGCDIEGDTDFIFGRGTAVFDGCTILYVAGRKTNSTHVAPSTESTNGFGFLVINSKIMGGAGISGTTFLGRAWDDSAALAPNGQTIIRNSEIGAHIVTSGPWTLAATSGRAFTAAGNRLYEYKNTGPGAAP